MDDKTKEAVERVKESINRDPSSVRMMISADDLRTLLLALEEAERDLQEAAKVVEPFANEFGDGIPRPDSMKLYGNLRLGDFRRARAFLTRLNAHKETGHD